MTPSTIFGIMRLTGDKKKFRQKFQESFKIFSSCGYRRREYLTLGSPFAIFEPWIWRRLGPVPACFFSFFRVTYYIEQDKRVPFEFLSALWDKFISFPKNSPRVPLHFLEICDRIDVEKHQSINNSVFFSAVLLKSFC